MKIRIRMSFALIICFMISMFTGCAWFAVSVMTIYFIFVDEDLLILELNTQHPDGTV